MVESVVALPKAGVCLMKGIQYVCFLHRVFSHAFRKRVIAEGVQETALYLELLALQKCPVGTAQLPLLFRYLLRHKVGGGGGA